MNLGFVIDNTSCIGCHACSTACKSENEVPVGVNRTWVKVVESGRHPDTRRTFQVTRCNHCANPPCVRICPTGAMHQRADGIVDFDSDACIGCKACLQACPYDAIHIDPESHTAAKCNFCAHRTDVGLEPACVVVCPEHAILAGDLDDPTSEIARVLGRSSVTVRKPEQGTAPKLFYIDGNDLALHPTAAARPATFLFTDRAREHHWQEPLGPWGDASQGLPAGGPIQVSGPMAAQIVQIAYNAQHKVPWHWPIPTYLVTKHVAGGAFLLLAAGALVGSFSPGVMVGVGALAIALTLVTLGLLVFDLDRPDRFFYLLVRPQWRSWVARAAWILTAFALVTGAWWAVETAGWLGIAPGLAEILRTPFGMAAAPLALLAAIYTAFLFAQAEGRDLWQAPHVPLQMTFQAVALGAGPLVVAGVPWARIAMLVALAGSAATMLAGDLGVPHATETARRAAQALIWGRWRVHYWWGGIVLGHIVPMALLVAAGPLAAVAAALCASAGVFLWARAWITAPQQVPNS